MLYLNILINKKIVQFIMVDFNPAHLKKIIFVYHIFEGVNLLQSLWING